MRGCGQRNAPISRASAWRWRRYTTGNKPRDQSTLIKEYHYYDKFWDMYAHRGGSPSKKNDVRNGLYCTGWSDHICSVPSGFLPCFPIVSCTAASAHTMLSSSSDLTLYMPDPHCMKWYSSMRMFLLGARPMVGTMSLADDFLVSAGRSGVVVFGLEGLFGQNVCVADLDVDRVLGI
jgi:hypothetical protein